MIVKHNERAVYLIFPNDPKNIQHSVEELVTLARGVEDDDLFKLIAPEMIALERKMKGADHE